MTTLADTICMSPARHAALSAIVEVGIVAPSDISKRLGIVRSSASSHIRELISHGFVERVGHGTYRASSDGVSAIECGKVFVVDGGNRNPPNVASRSLEEAWELDRAKAQAARLAKAARALGWAEGQLVRRMAA